MKNFFIFFILYGICSQIYISAKPNNIYILVHGTWALNAHWHQLSSAFSDNLAKSTADLKATVITFNWTGGPNHKDRVIASRTLAQIIDSYPDNINMHIIAHSHGANVGILASQILGKNNENKARIKTFYALGAPVDTERYMPDMNVIEYYYNFFSFKDLVQPVLGLYERILPQHERIANIRILIEAKEPTHIEIHSPIIALWLPYIHSHLMKQKINNFETFNFLAKSTINFYPDKAPAYTMDPDREKYLAEDREFNQELCYLFREESLQHKQSA